MAPIPRYASKRGPSILLQGFRPFFAAAALFGALAIPLWLLVHNGTIPAQGLWSPMDMHAHEMIFGFIAAIVAGFLLTAVPNWTGRLPLQGWPLAVLVSLWLTGRVAALFAGTLGPWLWLAADLVFPLALFAAIAREIFAGKNWRNLRVLAILGGLIVANACFHYHAAQGDADGARRAGLALMVVLVALIGGRIVPSFTANWLRPLGGRLPVPFNRFDAAAMIATLIAMAAWIVFPDARATGALALLAGLLQAVRLARWAGDRTWREPILFILHVGYAFIPLGFLLLAGAILTEEFPQVASIHAWGVGACGIMPMAVMTRVALAHTRRTIHADRAIVAVYGLIVFAALARIAVAIGVHNHALLWLAGLAWSGGLLVFFVRYIPVLFGPPAGVPR